MVEIFLAIALIAFIVAGFAAMWYWAASSVERKWREAVETSSTKMLVEQKRIIRRITRERNKWELAASRAMGIRLNLPASPSETQHKSTRRIVSPTEAIRRERDRLDAEPPIPMTTAKVPPAIANGFLKDAKK